MPIDHDDLKNFHTLSSNNRQSLDAKQKLIDFKRTWKLDQPKDLNSSYYVVFIFLFLFSLSFVYKYSSFDINYLKAQNLYGEGDYINAAKLLELSCNNGNGEACAAAGVMYDEGQYIQENKDKAILLYSQSCKLECKEGCNNLDMMIKNPY